MQVFTLLSFVRSDHCFSESDGERTEANLEIRWFHSNQKLSFGGIVEQRNAEFNGEIIPS